jgi:hypothetical protein
MMEVGTSGLDYHERTAAAAAATAAGNFCLAILHFPLVCQVMSH